MDDVLHVGIVGDVDGDLLALAKAQNWSGYHTVVGEGIDDLSRREIEPQWSDAKRVIGRIQGLAVGRAETCSKRSSRRSGTDDKSTAVNP